jgi:hypothetical protein
MNRFVKIITATLLALTLAACGSSDDDDTPDPDDHDYTAMNVMVLGHPGMYCVMQWLPPGLYVTNCYPYGVQAPYSSKSYFPKGCSCPPVLAKPKDYKAPKPVAPPKAPAPAKPVTPPKAPAAGRK